MSKNEELSLSHVEFSMGCHIDEDGEIRCEHDLDVAGFYINKDDALKIINHLRVVFEL